MLSITIPLWLLLSMAGLPALILIGLCARLIRMKRHKEALTFAVPLPESAPAAPGGFDNRFQREVLDQQIDAVFDVLKTLIETERYKLTALVYHAHGLPMTEPGAEVPAFVEKSVEQPRMDAPAPETTEVPLAQNIANLAEAGLAATEIARQLGISHSEVTLALKMRIGASPAMGRKILAVA